MATYCFICPMCRAESERDDNPRWIFCDDCNVPLRRNYKAENANINREAIRAVPKGR